MARRSASPRKQFKRSLFGYRRRAVRAHLATIDQTIAELRAAADAPVGDDHHDLVVRATRRAVEEVMARAQADANAIRVQAQADAEEVFGPKPSPPLANS